MVGFERRGGTLHADGASALDGAERFGTPLYVYSRADLVEAYRGYERAFAEVPHRICYAVKANGNGHLRRRFAEAGAGADIVSGFEMKAGLGAGFSPERIVFAGVGKTAAEIELGVELGIGDFNAESEDEISRISAAATRRGRMVKVSLRVNPDIDPRSHPYISTGLRENKFGVDIAQAPDILRRARSLPGLRIAGVQCHIGSQITDLAPLGQAAREVAGLSRALLDEGFPLEMIDLGGGLGVDYEEGRLPDPDRLAEQILPAISGLPLN